MTPHEELAERIRTALADLSDVREVRMFGGLSFMVHDKMVVASDREGGLLVRADPDRHEELTARPGAGPAEMGAGRTMGPSWIRVARDAIDADEELASWIDVALEFNEASRG